MIEHFLHDTIAADRKPLEEKMAKANLIDKYIANKESAKIRAKAPAPKRDSLPNPEDTPLDESPAAISQPPAPGTNRQNRR